MFFESTHLGLNERDGRYHTLVNTEMEVSLLRLARLLNAGYYGVATTSVKKFGDIQDLLCDEHVEFIILETSKFTITFDKNNRKHQFTIAGQSREDNDKLIRKIENGLI